MITYLSVFVHIVCLSVSVSLFGYRLLKKYIPQRCFKPRIILLSRPVFNEVSMNLILERSGARVSIRISSQLYMSRVRSFAFEHILSHWLRCPED